jgi:hypothetical protein
LSAKPDERYLVENKQVDEPKEEAQLAILCLRYLTFECFEPSIDRNAMMGFVQDGYYAFIDYASIHWNHHLETAIQKLAPEELNLTSDLAIAINEFYEIYQPGTLNQNEATTKYLHKLATPNSSKTYESAILLLDEAFSSRLAEDHLEALGSMGKTMIELRQILEDLSINLAVDSSPPTLHNLQQFYGHNWYKCSRHACYYFHEGFADKGRLTQYTNKHERPFCCTEMGCTRMYIGWSTERELKKHIASAHPDPEAFSWKFPHVKKPPTVFPCKECEKQFTRASTLKTHIQRHTEEKPFLCKICQKSFVRKYDCDRHESIHSNKSERSEQVLKEDRVMVAAYVEDLSEQVHGEQVLGDTSLQSST